MSDDWFRLNEVQEAFNEINAFDFMLGQLYKASEEKDLDQVMNITAALKAFYPVFVENWDATFLKAWDHFITPEV